MSSHLFSFDHLTNLHLKNVDIKLPASFKGFNKLVNLSLHKLVIDNEDLNMFLSRCHVLEFLDMDCLERSSDHCLSFLDIDCPKLKCFRFVGFFLSIRFSCADLEEIWLSYYCQSYLEDSVHDYRDLESNLVKVFSQLPCIERVHLDGSLVQFFSLGQSGCPQRLPNNLNHLTTLKLSNIRVGAMEHVGCVFCLIKSSPNLQLLSIEGISSFGREYPIEYMEEQKACNVSLDHLKVLQVTDLLGKKAEIEFIEVLLTWSTELKRVELTQSLYGCRRHHRRQQSGLFEKVSSLLRPGTKLVFDQAYAVLVDYR